MMEYFFTCDSGRKVKIVSDIGIVTILTLEVGNPEHDAIIAVLDAEAAQREVLGGLMSEDEETALEVFSTLT